MINITKKLHTYHNLQLGSVAGNFPVTGAVTDTLKVDWRVAVVAPPQKLPVV